jgi:hypothetical protein
MNGPGKSIWPTGESYVGNWKDNSWEGQGTYIGPNKEKYVGEWHRSSRYGKGTQYNPDGTVKYKGEWKDDKPVLNAASLKEYGERLIDAMDEYNMNDDIRFVLGLNKIINEYPRNFNSLVDPVGKAAAGIEYWPSKYHLSYGEKPDHIYPSKIIGTSVYAVHFLTTAKKDDALKKFDVMAEKISQVEMFCCGMDKVEKSTDENRKVIEWRVTTLNAGRDPKLKDAVVRLFSAFDDEDATYTVGILLCHYAQ